MINGNRKGFERLESRNMLATLVVNSLDDFGSDNDDGTLTLREAIAAVNLQYFPQVLGGDLTQIEGIPGTPGDIDRIVFADGVNDPVNLFSGGPATIELEHGELWVRNSVMILGPGYNQLTIDGSNQGGGGWPGSKASAETPGAVELTPRW